MKDSIQASVAIIAKNSGATLPRALESVRQFSEIIIADGGSTDATRGIARSAHAVLIEQDTSFLDAQGKIIDFSGVRNQCVKKATNDWIFFLDSDEYMSPELPEEIREAVQNASLAAYWVPRKYVFDGMIIERSIAYPNRQIRFFHKSTGSGFRKPIHERFEPGPSAEIRTLKNPIYVPVEADLAALRRKNDRYITLELERLSPLRLTTLLRIVFDSSKLFILYSFRLIRVLVFERGARLPLSHELSVFRYHALLSIRALARYLAL